MTKKEEIDKFLSALIGMSVEEAISTINSFGYVCRITASEGHHFIVTQDYKHDRVNIHTFGGKVTSATVG